MDARPTLEGRTDRAEALTEAERENRAENASKFSHWDDQNVLKVVCFPLDTSHVKTSGRAET